ncbi:tRNA threonylcarbamoyladenosine dehydratase [Ruminococcus sp.]|uniref:tRNA threonylcarbamoyladenosine dehydratase n=1 Tax=Ruminococcus sp. TaxID=41978 RepID=UPI003F11F0E9
MDERFIRTSLVIGEDNIDRLLESRVAVFGVGGVGGFVCEALARSGVGKLTLIDGDTVAKSNINRQIIALESTVGRHKAEVMKERILDINPNAEVATHNIFLNAETASTIDFTQFDYIVDAVDDIKAKVLLAKLADENKIPIIAAMGAGNKTDPTKFEVSDIFKTSVCPLARIMRHELKKAGIKKLKVVYSKETPKNPPYRIEGEKTVGSLAFVPSVMGLIMAGEVIKDICKIG